MGIGKSFIGFHPNKIDFPAMPLKSIHRSAAVLIGATTATEGLIGFFFHFGAKHSHIATDPNHGVARSECSSCEESHNKEFYGIFHVKQEMAWEIRVVNFTLNYDVFQ
jgi:hypothetical protein